MEQLKDISTGYRWVVWFAFKWLAATTAVTVWQVSAGFIPTASDNVQFFFRIAACVVMFFFIDAGLEAQAKYVFRGLMDKQTRDGGKWFLTLSIFIFTIRFAASTFMTWVSADPIASSIYPPPSTDRQQTEIAAARESNDGRLKRLESEKTRLENSEKQRMKDAEKQGKQLVDKAINAGGSNFASLWRDGNDWIKTAPQLKKKREKVYEAQKAADALIASEKAKTAEAQKMYLAALGKDDATIAALSGEIVSLNEQHATNKASMTAAIYLVDFIAAFVAIALLIALCSYEKKNNIEYKSDFSGVWEKVGDRIKGDVMQNAESGSVGLWLIVAAPLVALVKFFRFLGVLMWIGIHNVETFFRIDLDGDGQIGAPKKSVTTKTETTDLISAKVGRTQIGFSVNKTDQKVGETPPTSTDLGTARFTDVGVTPTSPTFAPTFEIVGDHKTPEMVGEKSVELPPTIERKITDLPQHKTPTIARKSAAIKSVDRANRATDLDKLADSLRAAWKKQYSTYPDLLRQAKAAGFTVYTNGKIISIVKPKPTPKRKK